VQKCARIVNLVRDRLWPFGGSCRLIGRREPEALSLSTTRDSTTAAERADSCLVLGALLIKLLQRRGHARDPAVAVFDALAQPLRLTSKSPSRVRAVSTAGAPKMMSSSLGAHVGFPARGTAMCWRCLPEFRVDKSGAGGHSR
jgi:hypothetical protein